LKYVNLKFLFVVDAGASLRKNLEKKMGKVAYLFNLKSEVTNYFPFSSPIQMISFKRKKNIRQKRNNGFRRYEIH